MGFDWRDRPASSPSSGALIQSRAGQNGNFEVVIPWPDGGLAHFWRVNDVEPRFPWHGPTIFGDGRYQGCSLTESDLKTFVSSSDRNLEVVAVHETGELHHFWRDNGGSTARPASMEDGWHYAGRIGADAYDEFSAIQSNFGTAKNENLELIARARDQRGFDAFFRDEELRWHGPVRVDDRSAEPLGVTSQALSASDALAALRGVNVDFSVAESDLRDWLSNPDFTPYPAISQAIFGRFRGRRLRAPVFVDVIAFNYEHTPGVASPRRLADVRMDVLDRAVVEGFNIRHGEGEVGLDDLLV